MKPHAVNQLPEDYGPLFRKFEPPAKPSTSQTARDASRKVVGKRVAQILGVLRDRGPSTLAEIAQAIGVHDHQISGRFKTMRLDGLIEFTGTRRPNRNTRIPGEVYRATPAGLAFAADNLSQNSPDSRAP
ncbi:MAG: hypothetical protein ACTHLZ_13520 [Tepidisphaeraceae bacterium]